MQYYLDTLLEAKMVAERLKYLTEKKETIYARLLGVSSPTGKSGEGSRSPGGSGKDKVVEFLDLIENKPQANGKTIQEEIDELKEDEAELIAALRQMNEILSQTEDFDGRYLYHRAVKRESLTEAIRNTADELNINERTAWRIYNEKRRKKVEMSVKCQ